VIKLKRAYEEPASCDGVRPSVVRLWTQGVREEALHLNGWVKDLVPTTEQHKWLARADARHGARAGGGRA
jgi:uncharacterized protein YeaO (DUF488 family)